MMPEGIQFNDFNSVNEGLHLLDRQAPSPDEKEIIESIPYSQGVLDFSMLLGERVFNNRQLSYELISDKMPYKQRKSLERRIKRLIVPKGEGNLYDTHDLGYYWRGKCSSVEVEDNAEFKYLIIRISFNVYPFLIRNKRYFDDVWDDFDFENDVANWTKHTVIGVKTITLVNSGDKSVKLTVNTEVD